MRKLSSIILMAVFCLGVAMPCARAQSAPVRIVLPYIPLMAEGPTEGFFIEMYQEIAKRTDKDIVIDVAPPRRAVQAFVSGVYDALGAFPSLTALPVSLASVPFYLRENLIFYKSGHFPADSLQHPDNLAGHNVGLSAYPYPPAITNLAGVNFERAPNDQSLLRMLANGRLDAAILEKFSGFHLRDQLGLSDVIDIADVSVTTENIFPLFQANRKGIENQKAFNLALYDMLCDGTLATLFGRDDVVPDLSLLERDIPVQNQRKDCVASGSNKTR
ncbi:hypothetical protein TH1_05510 [Thalassospira lucentensis MCCC 1A00383 = DSM 14000]|nr:hypothetical protein TH1_05510 [Thalassospira lucentensis MCCC 1A00383 = DSM 14000]